MEFVKYDTSDDWLEVSGDDLYTVNGVLATDSAWLTDARKRYSRRYEAQDWHHLYLQVGFVPPSLYDVTASVVTDWWVREDGLNITGDANKIAIYFYGIDTPKAEEWLEAMGWVRIKGDPCWCREQKKLGKYKNVTPEQYSSIEAIASLLDIYPENILDWSGTYA